VQVTVAETVGMEGHRGSYYDHAGAIRDVMQNHVLQLLAYAAMDAPGGLKGVNVRTEKLRVLRNIVPIRGKDVEASVVRGQYSAGLVEGEKVPAYRDEFGAEPGTWSPYTYDSLNFLADGVEKAGSADAKMLTPVLDAVHGRKGWTGSITIDPHNGNRRPATVVIVKTDPAGVLQVDPDWAKAVGAPYSG
jgi:hypothetical protein